MKRYLIFFLLILIMTVSNSYADEDVEQIGEEEERQGVIIIMDEYNFKPDTIVFREGVEAEIVLRNDGKEMHEFVTDHPINGEVKVGKVVVEAYGVGELEIEPKGEATITFTPEEKGRFPFSCRVKEENDHYKEGMRGILEIR